MIGLGKSVSKALKVFGSCVHTLSTGLIPTLQLFGHTMYIIARLEAIHSGWGLSYVAETKIF